MNIQMWGQLEIDLTRGVIYFTNDEGKTCLRICNLPSPIPVGKAIDWLDITHMKGVSWSGRSYTTTSTTTSD